VAPGHHQDDRQEPREGQGVARQPRGAKTAVSAGGVCVDVLRDPVRIDDRDQPVQQGDHVEREHRAEQERVEHEADQFDPIEPKHDAGQQGRQEHGCGREGEGPIGRADVPVSETGEEQGEKRRRERRPSARSRVLRLVHRG
jgi:hypothetical protein